MFAITIPLTGNNYCYLEKIHPANLTFSQKDELGLIIGSLIKIDSFAKGSDDESINRKVYPSDREIYYSNNRFKRNGALKIKISTIRKINTKVDRLMKKHIFRYIYLKKIKYPHLMYKDCIQLFIDEFGLSESDKLFETLKKFDYRKRTGNGDPTIQW